jgi:hypothetical protein
MAPTRYSGPEHYGVDRWVDFARGLESEEESGKMVRHAENCAACHDLMTFCRKLAVVAARSNGR